jgi:3-oxoacyl-[acyl-carrier protein] reductase
VALVTGGGSGIGRGIATAFVHEGARVAICGRREEPLRSVSYGLGGADVCRPVVADVTDAADRTRMLKETRDAFGGLDILVNNAGAVRGAGPIADLAEDDWAAGLAVNATAPLFLSRAALPMLRVRNGCILNISTGASLKPVPGFGAYGATKAALNYVSQVLAIEAAPEVRVNVICPGTVETPIYGTFVPADDIEGMFRGCADSTPLARMGQPRDVAGAAVFLCSEAAAFVTGALLVVDGGLNLG